MFFVCVMIQNGIPDKIRTCYPDLRRILLFRMSYWNMKLVPSAGLEPACLAAAMFETAMSAIPSTWHFKQKMVLLARFELALRGF